MKMMNHMLMLCKRCANKCALFVVALGVTLLSACGAQQSIIPERGYSADTTQSPGIADAGKAAWQGVTLTLDRAAKKVTFTMPDKSKIESTFEQAPVSTWPNACPGNTTSSLLEILQLKADLTIGTLTFKKPVLVADCFYRGPSDPNPEKVTLVEDTAVGTSGIVPCEQAGQCVTFRTKIDCDPTKGPCA